MSKGNTLLAGIVACKGRYTTDLRKIASEMGGLRFAICCDDTNDDESCGVSIWRGDAQGLGTSHFLGSLAEVKYRLKAANAPIDLVDVFNSAIKLDQRAKTAKP